jgi:hypothetical protein
MDLVLSTFDITSQKAFFTRRNVGKVELSSNRNYTGPVMFGYPDGREVGCLKTVDYNPTQNDCCAVLEVKDRETAGMLLEGVLSTLVIPQRPGDSPFLTDNVMPPGSVFRVLGHSSGEALSKAFCPSKGKLRQAAMTEVYRYRNSSPEQLAKWADGHAAQQSTPLRKTDRTNPNVIAAQQAGASAEDFGRSLTDALLQVAARGAVEETRQNPNLKLSRQR